MVERPSRKSGTGRDTLTEVLNRSGDPTGGPQLVGRHTRKSGSGRETLRQVRKW